MSRGGYSVTKIDLLPCAAAIVLLSVALLLGGCSAEPEAFPDPGNVTESVEIIRRSETGHIVIAFSSYPLRADAPPDGVRSAIVRAIGRYPCSAAVFYWSERQLSDKWLREQIAIRFPRGEVPRIILAGYGLGATEAAETARALANDPSGIIVSLLVTVDALKTNRFTSAAGVTGSVIAGRIPGVKNNFTAYDSAPIPDGMRLLRHVNYFQRTTSLYHGAPMHGAENHLITDASGLLNHGGVDDIAAPLVASDIMAVFAREARP